MARPVVLGNGSLTVGLNEHGLVHDFYYPYVGLDNLTTSRSMHHLIGIWADGHFSWVDDGSWNINVNFESDALMSNIKLINESLKIELRLQDFVDFEHNAFCRTIEVINQGESKREIRLFMHQVFQISRAGRGDTALFVPDENYILDYKGRCSLLIYAQVRNGPVFDQFAIGNYAIEGKEGSFRDAEDGVLSGNAVEHGGVDSVIGISLNLEAASKETVDYWIVAADSQFTAEKIHHQIKQEGLSERIVSNRSYWLEWLATANDSLINIDAKYIDHVKKSLLVIKSHIDRRGGIIASCDSSIYNYGRDYYSYVWPRDGAFVIWPLIRLGFQQEPKRFFEFCRDILTKDGYLMHKYQPDRAIGSTWHPLLHGQRTELAIQEDETAIVIFMLGEYYKHFQDEDFVRNLYATLVQPAANFMTKFVDQQTALPHASYDLWEEKFLTNTYTAAAVYKALEVAAFFADEFNYPDDSVNWRAISEKMLNNSNIFFDLAKKTFIKGYLLNPEDKTIAFDNTLDVSSLYGITTFGFFKPEDSHKIRSTVEAIESKLLDKSPSRGSPRYEHDQYFASDPAFQGNPWFVTTLWIAQYYNKTNQSDRTKTYLEWAIDRALPSGVFSEQVEPTDGSPKSVTPLIWSHAEFINTVLDLL